ncbi:unnamed protein product, partial [Pylaiella littoralis]
RHPVFFCLFFSAFSLFSFLSSFGFIGLVCCFSVEPIFLLCGLWELSCFAACSHTRTHAVPACVRFSRTRKMAAVQGNAGSTTLSVEGAGGAGDSLGGNASEPVTESVPALRSPPETQAAVDAGNGKTVQVTLEEPMEGKRRFSSRVLEYALSSWHVPGFRSHLSVR